MVTATQSIREIAAAHASAAVVFERFEIDLCSLADKSLDRVCAELQLSVDQVLEKLSDAAAGERGAAPADLADRSLGRLIQHIVRTHHQYVRRELPGLVAMGHKLAKKRGEDAPELQQIARILDGLRADLFVHFQKEEGVLFPLITEMDQADGAGGKGPRFCFGSVEQPVSRMIMEHESAENLVAQIRELAHEFTPPDWACPTHLAMYAGLREFADDLRQHVHLENDLLFPRAVTLEAELRGRRVR